MKRAVAVKVPLAFVLNAAYVKDDATMANYLQVSDMQVSRVNVIATVVVDASGDPNVLVIDDGQDKIELRVFENPGLLSSFTVGNTVLVIGKPREYSGQKYLIPEIVREIDPAWQLVRKKEIELSGVLDLLSNQESFKPEEKSFTERVMEAEAVSESVEESVDGKSDADVVFDYIRSHDKGDGVDIEEMIEGTSLNDGEKCVKSLLMNGDIFEVRPGRVKVLD